MPPFEVQLYWDQRRDADPAQQWLRRQLLTALAGPELAQIDNSASSAIATR